METKRPLPEETIFVLLARDEKAPVTIVEWIKQSLLTQPADKLHKALDTAIKMAADHEEIRLEVEKKKLKDKTFTKDEDF